VADPGTPAINVLFLKVDIKVPLGALVIVEVEIMLVLKTKLDYELQNKYKFKIVVNDNINNGVNIDFFNNL
jgi:hypothetical protein